MSYRQTHDDFKEHLKEQIQFLLNSVDSFDNGFENEAKRIAVRLRVLLHDTRKSTSLLTHLNRKNILFYDTALDYRKYRTMALIGIELSTGDGPKYRAPLDSGPPIRYQKGKVSFDQWWNEIVLMDQDNNEFTRKSLVLIMVNQEGGAHIDKELNDAYAKLTRSESLGWRFTNKGKSIRTYPVHVVIRQICHEVLKTFNDEFPEYFT
ncbi:hypothetical protein ES705_16880 [subsurface metagenome]